MKSQILSVKRRSHALRWGLSFVGVTAIAAGIVYGYIHDVAKPQVVVKTGQSVSPFAFSNSVTPKMQNAPTSTTPVKVAGETQSQQFKRLTATKDPKDGYEAYLIAARCVRAKDYTSRGLRDLLTEPVEKTCGDLDPGQLSDSRFQYLETAAAKGVLGAFTTWQGDASPRLANGGFAPLNDYPEAKAKFAVYQHQARITPEYWGHKDPPPPPPPEGWMSPWNPNGAKHP